MPAVTPLSKIVTIDEKLQQCQLHQWTKESNDESVVAVVYHGFLAHGLYPTVRYCAELLSENDINVVAFDLPGHGSSPGSRGYLQSSDFVLQYSTAMADYTLTTLYPNAKKIVFVGSSMGGCIALSVSQKIKQSGRANVLGVVLLAPMLALSVSKIEHGALSFLSAIVPTVPLIPSSSTSLEKQYRDEAKRKECENDPGIVKLNSLRVASALTCVDMATNIQKEFENFTVPFLLQVAEQDVVVKNEGSLELYAKSPSTDKTIKFYPALHGLLCEPAPLVDQIQNDIISWIKERL